MRNRTPVVAIGLVALVIGLILGGQWTSRASAGPTEVLAQSLYITNSQDGQQVYVWQMEGGRFVRARAYGLGGGGVLNESVYSPPAPKAPGGK